VSVGLRVLEKSDRSIFESKIMIKLFSATKRAYFFCLCGILIVANVSGAEFPNFADLVEEHSASIVEISTLRNVKKQASRDRGGIDELLRQFGPGGVPGGDQGQAPLRTPRRAAVGSGFIVSSDGFVITNNHVVAGADEIRVHLNDRRVFDAEVIGLDEPSDIALLKLDAEALPFVDFGNSDAVRVGEWVLAIGSPFGLEFSAAAGIVSAKGRSVPGRSSYNYMAFIQSDVAINQGNSGGPLFNLEGEVIGINSQIISSTGGSNGISFSIPSNVAMNVISQLKEDGRVERGLLGVRMREVDFALAEIFDMDIPRGAFVDGVMPESPAGNAGIKNEDIIVKFNGHDIKYYTDLPFYVGQYRPNTEAEIIFYRQGIQQETTVVLGSSPTNEGLGLETLVQPVRNNPLGFRVEELSEDIKEVAGIEGVRIVQLKPGPGADAGLREGDVVVALNRNEISSVESFTRVAESLPVSGFISVRVVREGQGTTLALELVR
jgi:serine protease Do